MLNRILLFVFMLSAASAGAQTLAGDRLRLNFGPCTFQTGAGSPEGVRVGKTCDTYVDTTSGALWTKWTGTNTNTGWYIGHNGNAVVNGTATINSYLTGSLYVSQLTGWRITADGAADFRYIYADEMHVRSFIADLEQALAGLQIIAKSVAPLAAGFACPAPGVATPIVLEPFAGYPDFQVFDTGDWVSIRQFDRANRTLTVADCLGQVSAPQTGVVQTWTFTRGTGGNAGGAATGAVIGAGAIALDYGAASGGGYHEVNAIDGPAGVNSPYAQTVVWAGSPAAANRRVRTRIGNLRGVTGTTGEYGFVAYGPEVTAPALQGYIRASNTGLDLRNMDMSMYSGITEVIRMDHNAPSIAIGTAVPTGFNAGDGIWMGRDVDGRAKWRVGSPTGPRVAWDGVGMTIVGEGGGITNINGQNIRTGSIGAAQATFGSGLNQLRNADCAVSTDDWAYFGDTGLPTMLANGLAPWNLNGGLNTCYVTVTGSPGPGTSTGAYLAPMFAVVPGLRYEASVYLGVHRAGLTAIYVQWFSAANLFVGQSAGTYCTSSFSGGQSLSGYCRSVFIGNAPSGATQARVVVQTAHTGETTPYLFFVHAMFGEAMANQTEASPWGPAGMTEIVGGMIRTQSISADKIVVNSLSALSANLGTVNAGVLNGVTLNAVTINGVTVNAGTLNAPNISGGAIQGVTITGVNITGTSSITGAAINGGTLNIGGNFIVEANGIMHAAAVDLFAGASITGGFVLNLVGPSIFTIPQFGGGGTRHLCVGDTGIVLPCS